MGEGAHPGGAPRGQPGSRSSRAALRAVALLMVLLLVALSTAAALNGQVFLAVVGLIGGIMTAWALTASLGRG